MADTKQILQEFRRLLAQGPTNTTKRNAVRTFHDFLKIELKRLAEPEEETFLGQVDIQKRFSYLAIKYPELTEFSELVRQCKSSRERVDHSDSQTPDGSELKRWDEAADVFSQRVEECRSLYYRKKADAEADKDMATSILIEEFEETQRLADMISAGVSAMGLGSSEQENALQMFYSLYQPFWGWNSKKLDSVSEYDLARAIAATARQNGLFRANIAGMIDVLASAAKSEGDKPN